MRTLASVSVVVFLILGGAQAGDDALRKKEFEALRGNWNVAKGAGDPELGVVTQFSMVENSLQIRISGGVHIDFKFTVNPAKKPKEIDLITRAPDGSERAMHGIYKLEGDTLEICFVDFGKKRPTEFKGKNHVKLTREKKKDK